MKCQENFRANSVSSLNENLETERELQRLSEVISFKRPSTGLEGDENEGVWEGGAFCDITERRYPELRVLKHTFWSGNS